MKNIDQIQNSRLTDEFNRDISEDLNSTFSILQNAPDIDLFWSLWLKDALISVGYMLAWYITSLTLSLYNKWLFSKDYLDFPYPLFTTFIHMLIQWLIAYLSVIYIWPELRPTKSPSRKDYFRKVLPCGFATGLDIGLSNSSLKFVLSDDFFVVLYNGKIRMSGVYPFFCISFWSGKANAEITCRHFRVILMVVGEFHFDMIGYLEVQSATVLSGLRWALVHVLLEKESMGMNNPLATTLYLAPLMAGSLLFFSASTEGLSQLLESKHFATMNDAVRTIGTIVGGGFLAFLMLMAEYNLISHTSVVTFSISGICKEILTLIVSHLIFGDIYTATNFVGLAISLVGLGMYNYIRITAMKEDFGKQRDEVELSLLEESNAYEGSRTIYDDSNMNWSDSFRNSGKKYNSVSKKQDIQ
ncbi:Triose-phosphate Transporter [Nowakowskiella sp. JEL0078]|nr:Triose-phosphate Transporter [Nowakowskiella sp. JEL0078]